MIPPKSIRVVTIGITAGVLLSANAQAADRPASPGAGPAVIRDCPGACPEMVLVPAGEFNMGSPATEEGRDPPEGPLHKVRIAGSFLVGKYDVTVSQYSRFVAETHHYNGDTCNEMTHLDWRNPGFPQEGSSPVVCVNFVDAKPTLRGSRNGQDTPTACCLKRSTSTSIAPAPARPSGGGRRSAKQRQLRGVWKHLGSRADLAGRQFSAQPVRPLRHHRQRLRLGL